MQPNLVQLRENLTGAARERLPNLQILQPPQNFGQEFNNLTAVVAQQTTVIQNLLQSHTNMQTSLLAMTNRLEIMERNFEIKLANQVSNPLQWLLNANGQPPANQPRLTHAEIISLTAAQIQPILVHYNLPVAGTIHSKRSSLLKFLGVNVYKYSVF
jgi:hypothetical protein